MLYAFAPLVQNVTLTIVDALWEDALILLAVALVLRLWRSVNATTRFAVWLVALIATIVVPIATALSVPATIADRGLVSVAQAHVIQSGRDTKRVAQSAIESYAAAISSRPKRVAVEATPSKISPSDARRMALVIPASATLAIAALWLAVAFALLVRLLIGLAKLETLKRNALPLPLEYRDALAHLNAGAADGREVRFCVSDETEVPVAVGLFDSMVLLPRHLVDSLSGDELRQVCLHELAHLRRADDWTNLLQRLVTALIWFSPAIYAIARRLDREREVACDDDVITETGAVRPYAQCLTKMAEVTAWPHHPLAAPGVFVTRRGISERVEHLLRTGKNAARGLALGPTAICLAIIGVLSLAMNMIAPGLVAPAALAQSAPLPQVPATPVPRPSPTMRAVNVPATHVHIPAHEVHVPPKHLHVSERNIHVAAQHIHVPATDVNVPAIDVRVPSVNVDVPGIDVKVPAMDFTVPAMHFHVPDYGRQFRGASCRSACNFNDVDWTGRDLRGRTYSATDFSDATLVGADFSHDTLDAVDFSDADLRHARFVGAKLDYVDFSDARLDGADFDGATISVCDFSGVDLSQIDLSRAKLGNICKLSLKNQR